MISELPPLQVQHQTATSFAYQQLKDAILRGQLVPGTRLREQELVSWLDVSRTPIREALGKLHTEGFIEVLSYKGAMVRQLDVDEIHEEYTLRAALEGLAAELAVQHLSAQGLEQLEQLALRLEQSLDSKDSDEYLEANYAFHFFLYSLSGSTRLVSEIDASWKKVNFYRRFAYALPGGWEDERKFHCELLEACRKRDAEEARRIVQRSCLEMSKSLVETVRAAAQNLP